MGKRRKKKKGNTIPARTKTDKVILASVFVSVGLTLPFITGQIPSIGNMLLPMHIPVLLCGYVLGWKYGIVVGFITPIIKSIMSGAPVMFPVAIAMAFELATYGFMTGLLYKKYERSNINTYFILIISMLSGRAVWGAVSAFLLGLQGTAFTREVFIAGAFTYAIPGIILQVFLIPILVIAFEKAGIIRDGE